MPSHVRTLILASAALLAASVGGTAAASSQLNDDPNTRVVGGEVVSSMDKNPGAVSLYAPSYNGFSCSAERIGPTWVMTARHCAELNPSRVYTNNLKHTTGDYANVKRRIYAPSGDMALIELDSAPAGPIMPWSDVAPASGENVRFYGWGMTSASARSSVLKTGVGRFSKTARNPFYGGTDLVFYGVDGAPWKGDSGGPVLDKQGRLIGTCSWSSSYGTDKTAQFGYTSTASLASWIKSTTGLNPGAAQPAPTPTTTPAPTTSSPAPTTPAPTTSTPAPTTSTPAPTTSTPAPTTTTPAPAPTTTTPAPAPTTDAPGISGTLIDVTTSNYDAVIKESNRRPVVLDFGASWCGACNDLKPIIKKHNAAAKGAWLLGMVDTDRNSALSKKHGVSLLPTVIPFRNGVEMTTPERFIGSNTDAWVANWTAQLTK